MRHEAKMILWTWLRLIRKNFKSTVYTSFWHSFLMSTFWMCSNNECHVTCISVGSNKATQKKKTSEGSWPGGSDYLVNNMCWLSFVKRLRGKTSWRSWRWVVLGAIRTHRISASIPATPKKKSKSTNNIRIYTRNHPSQNESTDRKHARNDFLLITTHLNHNSGGSPPNHKTKNTDRSINSHLSESLMSLCEVAAESQLPIPFFFNDIPKLSHIQSINWLYTHTVYQLTVWRL